MLNRQLNAKSVISNIASLSFIHIVNYLIPLITIPIILRSLGLEDFGRYSFLLGLCLYFSILIEFGLTIPATKYVSENRDDSEKLSKHYFNIITIRVFLASLCLALLLLSSIYIDLVKNDLNVLIVLFGVVLSQSISPAWIFVGVEYVKPYALCIAISKTLYLLLLLLLSSGITVYSLAVIYSVTSILGALLSILYVFRKLNLRVSGVRIKLKEISLLAVQSIDLFITTLFGSVYINFPSVIIAVSLGFEAVGVFSVCDKIISAVKGAIQPVTQSLFPHLIKVNDGLSFAFIKRIKKLLTMYIIFSLVTLVFLWIFSDLIISFAVGSPSELAKNCLRGMSLLPLFFGVSNILGNNVMLVLNQRKAYFYCLMCGAIFGISMITISALYLSVTYVAMSMVMTEALLCLLMTNYIFGKKREA